MRIGLIGLDTSHSEIFTRLLNDINDENHVPGGKITHAIPVFSEDLLISRERFSNYKDIVTEEYGVQLVSTIEDFMEEIDAVIIGTVDGRNHLYWFEQIVQYKKPVFIDKPIVINSKDMTRLMELSNEYKTPVMSASSLRYSSSLRSIKEKTMDGFESAYFYGPLPFQDVMPGYFWYGVHMIEQISALLGPDLKVIDRIKSADYEILRLISNEVNQITIRGDYNWNNRFGGVIHFKDRTETFELWKEERPYYANLLEEILVFFKSSKSGVSLEETANLISLIEQINDMCECT